MRVENMKSPKSGNAVANQFVIDNDSIIVFQSYESKIIEIDYDTRTILIGKDWDWGSTTSTYRNIFFRDYTELTSLADKKNLVKAMKDGKTFDDYGNPYTVQCV